MCFDGRYDQIQSKGGKSLLVEDFQQQETEFRPLAEALVKHAGI